MTLADDTSSPQATPPHDDEDPGGFMKALFEGVIEDERICPFPELAPAEQRRHERLMADLRTMVIPLVDARGADASRSHAPALLTAARSAGLFGMHVGKAAGGRGAPLMSTAAVLQELAASDMALAASVLAHGGMAVRAIQRAGTDAQRARWLPKMATGQALGAYAMSEPTAGSDAGAMKTRVFDDDGTLRIDGTKMYVVNGTSAEVFVVLARTQDGRRPAITAYVVERGEGVAVGARRRTTGLAALELPSVAFERAPLPEGAQLGERAKGFPLALEVQQEARVEIAALCLGGSQAAMSAAIRRANHRVAFNRRIGAFGMVQEKLAKMACQAYALECVVGLTAGLIDAGEHDCSIESAICKTLAAETYKHIAGDAMEIAAGMGTLVDHPFERHLRDAYTLAPYGGAPDTLRAFIALAGLQGPGERKGAVPASIRDRIKGLGLFRERGAGARKARFGRERFSRAHPALGRESVLFEEAAAALGREVERVARKHGEDVSRRQFVQRRLADVVIDLYALAAVIARTSHRVEQRGVDGARRELDLATGFAELARRRFGPTLDAMDRDADELLKHIAAGELTGAEEV